MIDPALHVRMGSARSIQIFASMHYCTYLGLQRSTLSVNLRQCSTLLKQSEVLLVPEWKIKGATRARARVVVAKHLASDQDLCPCFHRLEHR